MTRTNELTPPVIDGNQVVASQRLTQYAVDHCKTAIAWIRSDGSIFYTNEAQRQQLGYSEQELKDMSVSDVDPNWPPHSWNEGWQRLKEAGITTFESLHRRKNGDVFPVEVTTSYIQHGDDECLFAFATDITERNRAAEALQDSESKQRAIFDHHYQLTGMLDCEGVLQLRIRRRWTSPTPRHPKLLDDTSGTRAGGSPHSRRKFDTQLSVQRKASSSGLNAPISEQMARSAISTSR